MVIYYAIENEENIFMPVKIRTKDQKDLKTQKLQSIHKRGI